MPAGQQNPVQNQQFKTPVNPAPQQNMPVPQANASPKSSIFSIFRKNKKFAYIGGGVGLVIIALIIVLVVSMLNKPAPITPSEVTITFWTRSIDEKTIQEIITKFQDENPLIKVKHERQTETDYKSRTITRLQQQSVNIGNIVELDENWVQEVQSNLSPIVDPITLSRYSVASINNNTYNTFTYGVPFAFDGIVLAYNKDHLAEINFSQEDFNKLDWSFLANRALSLTKTKKVTFPDNNSKTIDQITRSGAAVGSPLSVTNAAEILELLLIQNEAKIYDPVLQKFTLNQKFLEVMKFYTDFTLQNIWADYLVNDVEAFANGQVSIILVRSRDIDKIKKLKPNLNFATAIPAKIGGIRNISLSKSLVLPNYMPNYDQSLKFVEFLTRTENGMELFNSQGTNTFIPAQLPALNQIPKESPFAVYSDINTTADRFASPNYDVIHQLIKKYLSDMYTNYAVQPGFGSKLPVNINVSELQSVLDQYTQSLQTF